MNARVLPAIAAAAVVLTACASVTSDINFQPPGSGWTGTPPILGRTQVWIKRGGTSTRNSVIVLVRGVTTTQNVFDNPGFGASDMRLSKNEQTKICGGEPAQHLLGTGKSNSGGRAVFEAYLATVHGEKYLAMYIRPQDQPADAQAETAIQSLCPKTA